MGRDRAITTERVFASVMGCSALSSPLRVPSRIPALEQQHGTSLELVRLYVGENGPRISDTGLLCRV